MYRSSTLLLVIVAASFVFAAPASAQQDDQQQVQKGQVFDAPQIQHRYSRSRTANKRAAQQANLLVLFEESFEGDVSAWTTEGVWEIGAPTSGPGGGYNSTNAAGTNLDGNHPDNADDRLISPVITLPSVSGEGELFLRFREWFEIESGFDAGLVEVSTDGGSSWTQLSARDGGSSWRDHQVDLTSYAGQDVRLAFRFTSDGSVTNAGWYLDDLQVAQDQPEPLTANISSLSAQNFPNVFMSVGVNTSEEENPVLSESNFEVYEDGTLQTDLFDVVPPEEGSGVRLADIVFLIDDTGSMDEEIAQVRDNVISFVDQLEGSEVNYNLGLLTYKDGVTVFNDGTLTDDAAAFQEQVGDLTAFGGDDTPENGLGALQVALNSFTYRPGSQKVFVLVTDATSHTPPGPYPDPVAPSPPSLDAINTAMQEAGATTYALAVDDPLYQGVGSITEATGGTFFFVTQPFTDILDDIGSEVSDSYRVRYRTANDALDGTERTVRVEVTYDGNAASDERTYVAGGTPSIARTDATKALADESHPSGTALTIAADITDEAAPDVEQARVFYKNASAPRDAYTAVEMTPQGGGRYRATIPGSDVGDPGVDYYITATDGESTASSPSVNPADNSWQIGILPNYKPQIEHTPITSASPGEPLDVAFTATDNTRELESVQLFYRRTGELTYQVETFDSFTNQSDFLLTIPAEYVTADGVDYYIKATDDWGVSSTSGTADGPYSVKPAASFPVSNLLQAMALSQELVTGNEFRSGPSARKKVQTLHLSQALTKKRVSVEFPWENLGQEYENGIGHQAYFSAGAFEVLDFGMYVDIDDYVGFTGEGKNGWVTVYIEGSASKGVGLPVSMGLLKTELDEERSDPMRRLEIVGPSISAGRAIEITTFSVEDGKFVDVDLNESLAIDASISYASASASLNKFEIRKSALNVILSTLLVVNPVTGLPGHVIATGLLENQLRQRFVKMKRAVELGSKGEVLYAVRDIVEDALVSPDDFREFTVSNNSQPRNFAAYIESALGGIDVDSDGIADNYCPVDPTSERRTRWSFLLNVRGAGSEEARYTVEADAPEGWRVLDPTSLIPRSRVITKESLSSGELGTTVWAVSVSPTATSDKAQVTFTLFPQGQSDSVLDEVTITFRRYNRTLVAYNGRSPVELNVETPSGQTIGPEAHDAGITMYNQFDIDNSGDEDAQVLIASPEDGPYNVEVVPNDDAQPSDTYTLEAISEGEVTTLAEDVPISNAPDEPYTHIPGRAATLTRSISQSFGNTEKPRNYRLVALPGAGETPLASTLEGTAGDNWRVFYDNGQSGSKDDYLVEHDGSDRFQFAPGRGFWMLSENAWQSSGETPTVSLAEDGSYTIALHAGWNILSNPFGTDLDWSAVQEANGVTQALWGWNGSYGEASTFASAQSGRAYYFFNEQGLDELALPYPTGASDASSAAAPAAQTQVADAKAAPALTLRATAEDDSLASSVAVGRAKGAKDGFDVRDQYAPPGAFAPTRLHLAAPFEAESGHDRLAAEYRPASGEGQRFEVVLQTDEANSSATLTASSLDAFADQQVVLIDQRSLRRYDLHEQRAAQVQPQGATTRFALLVGSAAFVEREAEQIAPEESQLVGNYPNPFRSKTTIAYTVAEPSHVRLTVYDMLGRRVRTLVDERQSPGREEVVLTSGELSSGVYIYRLEIDDYTDTGKLTLIR